MPNLLFVLRRDPPAVILRALGIATLAVLAFWPFIVVQLPVSSTFYLETVTVALITGILVLSLHLAMGYAGMFSFVHTGLLAIGGYVAASLALKAHWNPWLTLPAAVAVTTVASIALTLVTLRATALYWGLITLSVDLVIIQVADQWSGVTGGFNGLPGVPRPPWIGGPMDDVAFYYLVLVALALSYLVIRNVVLSGVGLRFQAVRESEATAASLGISPNQTRVLAFAIAGGIAGLAGALYAQELNYISPDVAAPGLGLILFIAIFLGGFGSLIGPLLGMGLVTIVQAQLVNVPEYSQLFLGLFLLVAIFALPRGLVGTWRTTRFFHGEEPEVRSPSGVRDPLEYAARQTETAGGAVLVARGVSKRFGGIRALRDVGLELRTGEIHGLIGPNGAGKTTLASCLSGQLKPEPGGEIRIRDRVLPRAPHDVARNGITRVFQIPHLFESVSVSSNVQTGMSMRIRYRWYAAALRLPSFTREQRKLKDEALDLLRLIDLEGLANRPASVLSHGQKRLVEILRAVATRPAVLILDEPATGLHEQDLERLESLIRSLRSRGLAILLIEHNMNFVMRLCDNITVLDFGEVIANGTPAEVSSSKAVREAYLGTPSRAASAVDKPIREEKPTSTKTALELTNLHVAFNQTVALQGVSMNVADGEIVTILGPNGAGKTTTLRAIAGLKRAASGRVSIGGRRIDRLPAPRIARLGVGLVPEGRRIFPDHTVLENLQLGGYIWRRDRHKLQETLDSVYELFPILRDRRSAPARTLSGGEAQMLAIGRALMLRPTLLMLDEPSLGLAPKMVDVVFEHLSDLHRRQNLTIVLVEQAASKALEFADRAYLMSGGSIVASGSALEMRRSPEVQRIYFGGEVA
jgi:ABC-type branched-subunit amino acid transport system ATPase component/ABC-type branched-subunit amino acid transport system permease subunit